ncbi:MAG: hypothetical protein IT168_00320 [Bryobacterales bacterium]|nr:hypothetical protein [Bryobacterales bacterium]
MASKEKRRHTSTVMPVFYATMAALLVHYAGMSSHELFDHWLNGAAFFRNLPGWIPVMIGVAGVLGGALLFWVVLSLKHHIETMLESAGYAVSGRLLDTALAKRLPNTSYHLKLALLGGVVVLFLCMLHWVAQESWTAITHGGHLGSASILVASIAGAVGCAALWRRLKRPRLRYRRGSFEGMDGLILFLSSPGAPLPHAAAKYSGRRMTDEEFLADFQYLMLEKLKHMPAHIEEVREHFGNKNSWAMPVWCIANAVKAGKCPQVVLIGSRPSDGFSGTLAMAPVFRSVVTSLLGPAAPPIHIRPEGQEGVDFEDFDRVADEVRLAREFLENNMGNDPTKRICVDITGGTKICTIVGLMTTLEPGLNTVYVSTSRLRVDVYDMQYVGEGEEAMPHPQM